MKWIILVYTTLLFTFYTNGQSILEINIKDCRVENSWEFLSEFKLFKDGNYIKTIKRGDSEYNAIPDLKPGIYKVEYTSMFDLIESKTIEISEKGTYSLEICLDYMNHNKSEYIPIIDRLKDNEGYSLQTESNGCFHHVKSDKVYFKREKDSYVMIFKNNKRVLSPKEVEILRYFEIELNALPSRYVCTTRDTYTIQYKRREIKKVDGGCSWRGGNFLWKALEIKNLACCD